MCERENAQALDAWLKNTAQRFYAIEYAWKKGEHPKRGEFSPDFFLKKGTWIFVTETKGDEEIADPSPENQKKFDQKYDLGFPLLSDEDHAVAEAYGAWGQKSMYGRSYMGIIRSAFLVDDKGVLAEVWPKISPKDTPKNLLKALSSA